MALCFAHAAAGYLAYEIARPEGQHRPALLAAAVALASAPDLDFLPGLLVGQPGAYHRGVTHTVGAAVLAAVVAFVLARRYLHARPGAVATWVGGVWASHLLLDLISADVVAPHGGRFLWPLSEEFYIAPVTLLPEIVIDGSGTVAFFASLVGSDTWLAWASDVAVLALALVSAAVVRIWRARAAGTELVGVPEGT
jgi:inner membrane protein